MFKHTLLITAIASSLVACGGDNKDNKNGTQKPPVTDQTPEPAKSKFVSNLEVLGSYQSGAEFASSAAEIVSYDATTDKLYVVNSQDQSVDVLTLDAANQPTKAATIDLQAAATDAGIQIGAANSVATKNGYVAVAIEAATKQDDGLIALYKSSDLSLIDTYSTGALPDMVGFSADGNYILSANEGEPSGDYTNDPEGSVTIVNIKPLAENKLATVEHVEFTDFNQGQSRHTEVANIRLPGPTGTSVAQDLEPEYIAFLANGKAVVALQENNAVAIIDIATASIDSIKDLGVKDWSQHKLDVTNKDDVFSPNTFNQLVGYYMPDTMVGYEQNGTSYFVTANEGDSREYIYEPTEQVCDDAGHDWDDGECLSFTDEARAKDLEVAPAHPLAINAGEKKGLGRIKVLTDKGDEIGANDNIYTMGARSISIWDAQGNQIADTGDTIAQKAYDADNINFNSDNESNASPDNRSDDKGIEPEALEVAEIEGRIYAFVGLERQGGIMVFDITKAEAPTYITYLNNRDFTQGVCTEVDEDGECDNDTYNTAAKDLGPESIDYFQRKGEHLLAVGNEVSGTTTLYRIALIEK